MKTPVLGLLIAAVALAGSTIYLSMQLKEERALAQSVTAETSALKARVAQFEQAQTNSGFASAGTGAVWGVISAPPIPKGPQLGPSEKLDASMQSVEAVAVNAPPRSQAFNKMMRSQIRANNRRMYADAGAELGLSKDETNKLIDLLTDQQTSGYEGAMDVASSDERRRLFAEARRDDKAEIADLIGPAKAAAFEDYQATIPVRQELDMLTRQFEGTDSGLDADQQKRLLAVLLEEHKRVPTPIFSDPAHHEEYAKAYAQWQNGYNERVATQARSILTPEQFAALNDYQEWQKEMREHMATMRPVLGTRGTANVITYSSAGPAISMDIVGEEPEATEAPRKSQ